MNPKELFFNGYIKIRNRKVEMKWTGQFATHVLENYLSNDGLHDLTHIEIQKLLKVSKYTPLGKRIYSADGVYKNKKYLTIFVLTNRYAVIKTCYRRYEKKKEKY